jgi:transcriptional regulator GlxA family with amidase domain
MSKKPLHVSLVVFPECDPSMIYGVFDVLWFSGRSSNDASIVANFEPRIVAATREPIKLITGVSILPQDTIDDIEHTDIVYVANVSVETATQLRSLDRRLIAWIQRMHAKGAQLYASCGGPLVLAEAGLLKGLEATTHWMYAPLFKNEFPDVRLHMDRVVVQSGPGHNIVCSGGASSWQDLSLMLVARHAGNAEALRLSKFFLFQWHRNGQLPFASMMQNINHGDGAILKCQEWVANYYERADAVTGMAAQSGLPKRTFDRRFKAATGYSPLNYIQALRIEEAKQLLETTDTPAEQIGREVGYEDAASFRRLFKRLSGMSPGDYRKNFQLPAFVGKTAMPKLREAAE